MSQPQNSLHSFQNSLKAFAQIIFRETHATGYAIFELTAADPGLALVVGFGAPIPEAALLEKSARAITVFPLHTEGLPDGYAAFSFADHATARSAEESLSTLAAAVEAIWAARHLDSHYLNLLTRLRQLEARLLDSKIVERARGLLAGTHEPDVIGAILRHVQTVLRPSATNRTLESIIQELEDEIEERRVTSQAKAILQTTHALSEEQAYTHLRLLSRKTRRRLKDVALDVMAQYTLEATA